MENIIMLILGVFISVVGIINIGYEFLRVVFLDFGKLPSFLYA